MSTLFRPEVVEGHRQGWLGSIQLVRPVSFAWLTALVVLAALAVGAYFYLGQYTQKARVSGYLVPDRGVIRLLSPQSATVVERHVREGSSVRQGEVMFVLSVDRATLGGSDTHEAVQASLAAREHSLLAASRQQREIQDTRLQALQRQLVDMRRELTQMGEEAALHRQRLALAEQSRSRLEALRNDHFVSAAQVQTKAEEVLALRAQLQSVQRLQAAHGREIGQIEAQLRELPLQAQAGQGEIERNLAALAQASAENEALRRIVVRAPSDGTVTAVSAEPGQPVSPNLPLANLLPRGAQLQAVLFAPSSAMGFVRSEQPVLLRYQAFPYQKFGHQRGQVLQVARAPLQASELSALSLPKSDEPMYRITVALDQQSVMAYGQSQPLAPGMRLDADVLLDRRRLVEWIFEPLLSIAGRV